MGSGGGDAAGPLRGALHSHTGRLFFPYFILFFIIFIYFFIQLGFQDLLLRALLRSNFPSGAGCGVTPTSSPQPLQPPGPHRMGCGVKSGAGPTCGYTPGALTALQAAGGPLIHGEPLDLAWGGFPRPSPRGVPPNS